MNKNIVIIIIIVLLLISIFLTLKFKKMIWPIPKKITSNFGERIRNGMKEFHNGIDISAPIGTPVKSPASGKVLQLITNLTGGKQLILLHDNGYKTGYAHLSEILVSLGQRVKEGEIVAKVGSTGISTGSHLHFTVRDKSGAVINPLTVLKA